LSLISTSNILVALTQGVSHVVVEVVGQAVVEAVVNAVVGLVNVVVGVVKVEVRKVRGLRGITPVGNVVHPPERAKRRQLRTRLGVYGVTQVVRRFPHSRCCPGMQVFLPDLRPFRLTPLTLTPTIGPPTLAAVSTL
jgi:hypothetical protein